MYNDCLNLYKDYLNFLQGNFDLIVQIFKNNLYKYLLLIFHLKRQNLYFFCIFMYHRHIYSLQ